MFYVTVLAKLVAALACSLENRQASFEGRGSQQYDTASNDTGGD